MFIADTRFQIAAICVFVIILQDYLRNKKLPLLSNKFFSTMLIFTGINLCFDLASLYAISHMDTFPLWLNRFFQQGFIISLMVMITSLYWYVEVLGHNQKRMTKKKFLWSMMPFGMLLAIVAFGTIKYHVTENKVYSYGFMTNAFYVCGVFYMVLIMLGTFLYGDNIQKEKKMAIRFSLFIWIAATTIQILNPGLLVSGLAVVLMLLFIYLSFENPKEHMDDDTGLFNKRAFHLMVSEKKESKKTFFIVDVVIEDLNRIQTMIGHTNTNVLLKVIGDKMQTTFQISAYHARSNVISVLVEKNSNKIPAMAKEMEIILRKPIDIEQFTVVAKSHIDILNADFCMERSDELYEMMNYMAEKNKAGRGNSIYVLNDVMVDEKMRYSTIEYMVQNAIQNDGFQVVYQPIYDVKSKEFHSAEALVRLKDTDTVGFVSPEIFIPIAEKKGMIMELGRIVFEKVCQYAKENDLEHMGIEYIEVNLSGIQCVHPELPTQLKHIMDQYRIRPSFMNLEVTETAAVESGEMLRKNMLRLRNMGCSFSMDDFGTGYSNLSQMAEVVYDLVKLDKSLIWPCFSSENKKSSAILENVIHMLLELKVHIVAEGVETKEMADYLSGQGVNYLQGYHYARPLAEEAFINFINENRGNEAYE